MSTSDDRVPGKVWKQRILELWKKSEHAVAYVLLVLVAVGEHINIPIVRESAVSILGVIILHEFFDLGKDRTRLRAVLTEIVTGTNEIRSELSQIRADRASLIITLNGITRGVDELTHAVRPQQRFSNISEAKPKIMDCIRECYQTDNRVEIKWIGMTMLNAGSTLIFGFNDLVIEGVVRELHMNLAMLDGSWVDTYQINKAWNSKRVDTSRNNLQQFFATKQAAGLNWHCAIRHYAHMPGIHGALINGKYLFLGMAQWLDGDMHAGERQYSFYTDQSADDREKIRVFEGWFDVCFNEKNNSARAASGT